jgi:unsaturated chondroitin disaccharide hydrolase
VKSGGNSKARFSLFREEGRVVLKNLAVFRRCLRAPEIPDLSSAMMKLSFVFLSAALSLPVAGDELLDRMPMVFGRAAAQYEHMLSSVESDPRLPRTIRADGSVVTVAPQDWTSGFFPGNLWLLHEYDGSAKWKEKALAYTRRLEVIRHFKGNHDGGFMLGCSYGNALRLDPSDEFRAVLRDAAAALGTRHIPSLGMIRSWDHKPYQCPVIIDNMMNLELLTWAARNGGDGKLRDIAVSHADKTLANHFRPDGTAYHVVDYDPATGWVRAVHGCQGADVRTPWARGQSWGLYGFTMMFRETGKPEYLALAEKLASVLMNHPNLPADRIPNWDFGISPGPEVPRDASAAAVMASGLLELSTLAADGARYREFAVKQLIALSAAPYLAEPKTNGGFILTSSTGHLPANSEINVPLVYADYYFLEALLRYRALSKGEKRQSFGQAK